VNKVGKAVQKAVSTMSNVAKAGKFIKDILYREDAEEMSQRDVKTFPLASPASSRSSARKEGRDKQ